MVAMRYTVNVYIVVGADDDGTPDETAREVERRVYKLITKQWDADCEVMESAVISDDEAAAYMNVRP